jgi:hypothetical protein
MTAAAPPLAPDLVAGLRRLKLAAIRQVAPELLITAKTQRWAPEELLRTLVEAEITAREASNSRTRMKNAAFPVTKTLDELDRSVCSIPGPTLDYLASLEWITAKENLCLVGPAGTGKSHVLVSLGISAVHAGHKVRYFTAADLVDTLYRGLADNSAGKVIENRSATTSSWSTKSGSPRSITPQRSCCSGWSQPPTNGGRSASPATGHSTSGAGSCPSTPPRSASWTACSTTPTSSSPTATPTACEKPGPKEEHA